MFTLLSKGVRKVKSWSDEHLDYLLDNWGSKSISVIAENLNRTVYAIMNKARRNKLGSFLDSGDYITLNQLFIALGRGNGATYTKNTWIKLGLPTHRKKVNTSSYKVVYIYEFWKWAKEYRMRIDFSKMQPLALGDEPEWAKEQRTADILFRKYKIQDWTNEEDHTLINLLNTYKYTYKELSLKMLRTEGAIKRRIQDLSLKVWPLREPPHSEWTEEQLRIVRDMYSKGYRADVIKEYIDKSAQAIQGRIERFIKIGELEKRK